MKITIKKFKLFISNIEFHISYFNLEKILLAMILIISTNNVKNKAPPKQEHASLHKDSSQTENHNG